MSWWTLLHVRWCCCSNPATRHKQKGSHTYTECYYDGCKRTTSVWLYRASESHQSCLRTSCIFIREEVPFMQNTYSSAVSEVHLHLFFFFHIHHWLFFFSLHSLFRVSLTCLFCTRHRQRTDALDAMIHVYISHAHLGNNPQAMFRRLRPPQIKKERDVCEASLWSKVTLDACPTPWQTTMHCSV